MGLIARALELEGIATTLVSWNAGMTRPIKPPRAVFTKTERGATLGDPGSVDQQRQILELTLSLLAQDAPIDPVRVKK